MLVRGEECGHAPIRGVRALRPYIVFNLCIFSCTFFLEQNFKLSWDIRYKCSIPVRVQSKIGPQKPLVIIEGEQKGDQH